MRPIHYEVESGLIKKLIENRHDFFLGGRGIGCKITPGKKDKWTIYFDRARLTFYCDMLKLENGKLIFTVDGGISGHGEVDLAHYLKVTVVW